MDLKGLETEANLAASSQIKTEPLINANEHWYGSRGRIKICHNCAGRTFAMANTWH